MKKKAGGSCLLQCVREENKKVEYKDKSRFKQVGFPGGVKAKIIFLQCNVAL